MDDKIFGEIFLYYSELFLLQRCDYVLHFRVVSVFVKLGGKKLVRVDVYSREKLNRTF